MTNGHHVTTATRNKNSNKKIMVTILHCILAWHSVLALETQQCTDIQNHTCLASSLPIIATLKTTDPNICCARCHAESECASWTVNLRNKECYLRLSSLASNKGNCVSGRVRSPKPPPPRPRPPANAPNILLILGYVIKPAYFLLDIQCKQCSHIFCASDN